MQIHLTGAMRILIAYTQRDYSSVKSLMDEKTYERLMMDITRERIEEQLNIALSRFIDLINKIIYEYYTQSLLVERGIPLDYCVYNCCNLLINGKNISAYGNLIGDESYFNIGGCAKQEEIPKVKVNFNVRGWRRTSRDSHN